MARRKGEGAGGDRAVSGKESPGEVMPTDVARAAEGNRMSSEKEGSDGMMRTEASQVAEEGMILAAPGGLGALAERTLAEIMQDADAGAANRLKAAQLAMERSPAKDGSASVTMQAARLAALLRGAGDPGDGGG